MAGTRYARLWVPLMAGVGGTAISLSVGLGQHAWPAIVIGEVLTLMAVAFLVFAGMQDTDMGALLGHRTDERQALIRLKAARMSAVVAVVASVVACVVSAAAGSTYWPFEVIYLGAGLSYVAGLRFYGADRDEPEPTEPGGQG